MHPETRPAKTAEGNRKRHVHRVTLPGQQFPIHLDRSGMMDANMNMNMNMNINITRRIVICPTWLLCGVLLLCESGQNAQAQVAPTGPLRPGQQTAKIAWHGTWKGGLAEAERTGKPILLVSAAPQCHSVPGVW